MGHTAQMGAPDFAAWGMNDATAQFGMQLGQSAVAAGQDYVQKNVRPTSHYFLYNTNDICIVSLVVSFRILP